MEDLGDQFLADPGAVGVGGVDQVDAQLGNSPQHRPGGVRIRRRAPDPVAAPSPVIRIAPKPIRPISMSPNVGIRDWCGS
jgi:hypothetical protein